MPEGYHPQLTRVCHSPSPFRPHRVSTYGTLDWIFLMRVTPHIACHCRPRPTAVSWCRQPSAAAGCYWLLGPISLWYMLQALALAIMALAQALTNYGGTDLWLMVVVLPSAVQQQLAASVPLAAANRSGLAGGRATEMSTSPSHFARRLVAHASPSLGFTPLAHRRRIPHWSSVAAASLAETDFGLPLAGPCPAADFLLPLPLWTSHDAAQHMSATPRRTPWLPPHGGLRSRRRSPRPSHAARVVRITFVADFPAPVGSLGTPLSSKRRSTRHPGSP